MTDEYGLMASENRLWSLHFPPEVESGEGSSEQDSVAGNRQRGNTNPSSPTPRAPVSSALGAPARTAATAPSLRLCRPTWPAPAPSPPRRRDLIEERSSSASTSCRRSPSTRL